MDARKEERVTAQIHEIYIKASADAIWEAITTPEWTARYGYRAPHEFDLRTGGQYHTKANDQMRTMGLPEVIIDGEVVEAQRPHKLVHTSRFLFSDANRAEGFTRITWEIVPTSAGFCRVTITHDVAGAPIMAAATSSKFDHQGGGGWNWILSDLKSLLETGKTMAG